MQVKGLRSSIIRPFNVAGPRQSQKVDLFCLGLSASCPKSSNNSFGDGSAIRAFTHVSDMSSGIILWMNKGSDGVAYNIGNPANKTTILELVERVKSQLFSSSEIIFVDPKTIYGDSYEEANDNTDANKARDELGWELLYDIDQVSLMHLMSKKDGR